MIFVFILNSGFPFPLRVMVNRSTVNDLLKVVLRLGLREVNIDKNVRNLVSGPRAAAKEK